MAKTAAYFEIVAAWAPPILTSLYHSYTQVAFSRKIISLNYALQLLIST